MFLDESGFLLIPTRRRTWGPEGHPPFVPYNYRHGKMSALATLTVSAQRHRMGLYTRFRKENFTAADVAEHLRLLLRYLRRHIILLWDGAPIHKGGPFRKMQEASPRLHFERFPAYAPELNPVEWLRKDCNGHMANSLLRDERHIHQRLHGAKRRVIRSQEKLRSFVEASHLPSTPWA